MEAVISQAGFGRLKAKEDAKQPFFFGLRSLEYIETQLPGGQLDIIIYVAVLSETHFLVLLCVGG